MRPALPVLRCGSLLACLGVIHKDDGRNQRLSLDFQAREVLCKVQRGVAGWGFLEKSFWKEAVEK